MADTAEVLLAEMGSSCPCWPVAGKCSCCRWWARARFLGTHATCKLTRQVGLGQVLPCTTRQAAKKAHRCTHVGVACRPNADREGQHKRWQSKRQAGVQCNQARRRQALTRAGHSLAVLLLRPRGACRQHGSHLQAGAQAGMRSQIGGQVGRQATGRRAAGGKAGQQQRLGPPQSSNRPGVHSSSSTMRRAAWRTCRGRRVKGYLGVSGLLLVLPDLHAAEAAASAGKWEAQGSQADGSCPVSPTPAPSSATRAQPDAFRSCRPQP